MYHHQSVTVFTREWNFRKNIRTFLGFHPTVCPKFPESVDYSIRHGSFLWTLEVRKATWYVYDIKLPIPPCTVRYISIYFTMMCQQHCFVTSIFLFIHQLAFSGILHLLVKIGNIKKTKQAAEMYAIAIHKKRTPILTNEHHRSVRICAVIGRRRLGPL